jgi:exopolysaccharide biosynthesis polyprenyl glycosylphosphotransferase
MTAPLALVALLLARAVSGGLTGALRRHGVGLERTVLVGGGPIGIAMADVLLARPEFGLDPVGFVEVGGVEHGLPTLGSPRDLVRVLLAGDVRRVVVTFSGSRESELVDVLRDCGQLRFEHRIHVLPRFFELGVAADTNGDDLWGFPLVPLHRPGPDRWARSLKRGIDVTVAGLLLVLTAPVFAAIALAVRLTSPGPALFRQKRVGQYGQVFELLKFRTMLPNDDGETQWCVDDDDRVTSIGRFLRPTHLDELPQLINVLRGDMALVGPRPERPTFVEQFSVEHRGYEDRHRVPVGLTGWAQVNGLWGDTSIADRARFDNAYIENWSMRRELSILLRTFPTLLGRRTDDGELAVADDAT